MAPVSAQLTPPRVSWAVRANNVLNHIVRYLLAIGMMPYGISKIFNYQFQVPASVYAKPLGDLPGTSLTWAFLGYQPWFQFLLGVLETLPAVLLLFRRTRRAGALLMLPMILNVALMNVAIDLWPATQQISTVFLAMNLYLLACDWPLWRRFTIELLHRRPAPPGRWRTAGNIGEAAVALLLPAAVTFYLFSQISSFEQPIVDFIGDRQINRAGTWIVRQLTLDGRDFPIQSESLVYFDFTKRCHYTADGHTSEGKFDADRARHTFRIDDITFAPGLSSIHGAYRIDGGRMILDSGPSSPTVHLVLERYRWGKQLPFRPAPRSSGDTHRL